MIDVRFPTALQVMLTLALAEKEGLPPLSSARLARGLATNASLVRALISPLVRDGLLVTMRGNTGGMKLARSPAEITLAQIYRAVTRDKQLWVPRDDVPRQCVISTNIGSFVEELSDGAEDVLFAYLSRYRLSEVLAELEAR